MCFTCRAVPCSSTKEKEGPEASPHATTQNSFPLSAVCSLPTPQELETPGTQQLPLSFWKRTLSNIHSEHHISHQTTTSTGWCHIDHIDPYSRRFASLFRDSRISRSYKYYKYTYPQVLYWHETDTTVNRTQPHSSRTVSRLSHLTTTTFSNSAHLALSFS